MSISEFVFGTRADSKKGVRAYMQQSRVFVGMVLILIFAEVLGLYGYACFCSLSLSGLMRRSEEADRRLTQTHRRSDTKHECEQLKESNRCVERVHGIILLAFTVVCRRVHGQFRARGNGG